MSLELIAFDADDTLWENEIYYREGRRLFDSIMDRHRVPQGARIELDKIEIENLQFYGYGAVGFAISMVEAGMKLTEGAISADEATELLAVARKIITQEVELMEGAEQVLSTLSADYPLLLITKGAVVHQRRKIDQSGLAKYFKRVEIVAEKDQNTYQRIFDRAGVLPSNVLMVGNSIRSDIQPVIELGGYAIHLTEHPSWDFEDQGVSELPTDRFFPVKEIVDVVKIVDRFDGASRE